MSFPNLDLYMVNLFAEFLEKARLDTFLIEDVFGGGVAEIQNYLSERRTIKSLHDIDEGIQSIIVLPSFPLMSAPFPQIGVYLGSEEPEDYFLGQSFAGEPVISGGETIGWDEISGYYSRVSYRVDVVDESKEGVIWLSRLCQRAMVEKLLELEGQGIVEARISLSDTKIEQEMFPSIMFSRSLMFSAKALNTWTKRTLGGGPWETGINTALEGL